MINKAIFRIKMIYNILRPSEKKVADYILSFNDDYAKLSMTLISKEVSVSQPTIMRFVKAIGYNSFKEFKYELLKNQKSNNVDILYGYTLGKEELIKDIPSNIVARTITMLEDSLKSISIKNYENAIKAIHNSNHISIFAVENSLSVANDLMIKLIYLGKQVVLYDDGYLQSINASNLNSNNLAIGISYSGNSKETVYALKIAYEKGAFTIAIVNFENTMLTQYANIVLSTSNDQLMYGDAIFSRTVQTALVDMLYMGVIKSDYDYYTKQLDYNSKLISHRGYLKEEQ